MSASCSLRFVLLGFFFALTDVYSYFSFKLFVDNLKYELYISFGKSQPHKLCIGAKSMFLIYESHEDTTNLSCDTLQSSTDTLHSSDSPHIKLKYRFKSRKIIG